eukprot:417100-Rhodomonas_salina.1
MRSGPLTHHCRPSVRREWAGEGGQRRKRRWQSRSRARMSFELAPHVQLVFRSEEQTPVRSVSFSVRLPASSPDLL